MNLDGWCRTDIGYVLDKGAYWMRLKQVPDGSQWFVEGYFLYRMPYTARYYDTLEEAVADLENQMNLLFEAAKAELQNGKRKFRNAIRRTMK